MARLAVPGGAGRGGGSGPRVVGDYMFWKLIGRGSFSDVWLARNRVRGTEVAVKEIAMERLSKKLQESLLSEIVILKKINHPNIIALLDIIEFPKTIYIILEYCRGGDLSMYIQRHGRVPEAIAKHFMQQLAMGLQVLRTHNLIHRDLKPQNLLLSSNDDNSALKIADFGFARPLQPRGLAETLCGSPLYMAPEIMQLQKYDAKADLWSVGVILFQLVTGRTPFTGNSQIELLQNIMKSNELHFPADSNDLSCDCIDLCQKLLRRNPVERLTFEEFFNHRFLSEILPDEPISHTLLQTADCVPLVECAQGSMPGKCAQEECLPFLLDDESTIQEGSSAMLTRNSSVQSTSSRQEGNQSVVTKNSSVRSTYGFTIRSNVDKMSSCDPSNNMDALSGYNSVYKPENATSSIDFNISSAGNVKEIKSTIHQCPGRFPSKDPMTTDSLDLIDQDYVLVSGLPMETSSSSVSASQTCNSPCNSEVTHIGSSRTFALSAPIKITGAPVTKICVTGSPESRSSQPSVASQGSVDMVDAMEQPSAHCLTRIRSLQQCASAISELVSEKVKTGRQLEAFSFQLVVLAICKQALHICHAQAASAIDGSPSQEIRDRRSVDKKGTSSSEDLSGTQSQLPHDISSQIERSFLLEVGHADELARDLGPVDETTEMPDAMEMVFQAALAMGRSGAVYELMEDMENAASSYSKAVRLLYFLLVEAPSLILNPPFSLTKSDRFRLRTYIDVLSNRQSQSRSTRITLLKCVDQRSL
uniref:Serine/threonine-protein kinase ATG1 n=1 Tax=Anthurium amnicola TaxID=1678845 RepID=A0A1D1ZEE2_9ARAE